MKFSYKLLKNLVPQIKSIEDLAAKLESYLFAVDSVSGDVLDIKILPNRYDAASYFGLAKEMAAILGVSVKIPKLSKVKGQGSKVVFKLAVKTNLCRRLAAVYIEGIKISESPQWLKDALTASGLRPINNLVDITNYVTFETGQPLHAFDFDKMEGGELMARPALKDEDLETLDGQRFDLDSNILVLADKISPLDVAGIKGGRKAEITNKTKNILLTAGNFDGGAIYRTSRRLKLVSDASLRFSHNLHPDLVELGLSRGVELIKELAGGKIGLVKDLYPKPYKRPPIKFDFKKFNQLTGLNLTEKQALKYLNLLDLKYRTDIERFEDLIEEVCRLNGYQNLPAAPPQLVLGPGAGEDQIVLKDKIRGLLTGFGLDEVYNYSFIAKGEVKLENPVSSDRAYLRPSLLPALEKNFIDNHRFFDRVAIFEIGKVWPDVNKETLMLGLALDDFLELKGIVDQLLEGLGVEEYFFREDGEKLRIEINHSVLGYLSVLGKAAVGEVGLDKLLKLVESEREFIPLSKFPSISRDLSLLVSRTIRIGQVMEVIENIPNHLIDLDLIDIYDSPDFGEDLQSLSFRLVFQAEDCTLTDAEVDKEMKKIGAVVVDKFEAEIR